LYDVLDPDHSMTVDGGAIHLDNQTAQSVKLIKIIDETLTPAAPTITTEVPEQAKVLQDVRFWTQTTEDSVPALAYKWDFGDGVMAEGPVQNHTYTKSGTYTVRLIVDGVDGLAAEKNLQVTVEGLMEIALPNGNVYQHE
jgi:PKD repeat protein